MPASRFVVAIGVLVALLAFDNAAVVEAQAAKKDFQDEVRTPASRELPKQRRTASADFQDSVWQAGRKEGENEDKQALYREPFTLESDEEIHSLLDAAHDRTLALIKQHEDPEHDGILRTHNVRDLMKLVLNPDNAPLSAKEQELFDTLLDGYVRNQGFAVPGQRLKRPVNKGLLHSWNTVFFLKDAVQDLRKTRAAEKARIAEEEEKARVAAELKKAEEAAAAAAAEKTASRQQTAPLILPEVDPLAALLSVTGEEQAAAVLQEQQQQQQQQQEQQQRQLEQQSTLRSSSSSGVKEPVAAQVERLENEFLGKKEL